MLLNEIQAHYWFSAIRSISTLELGEALLDGYLFLKLMKNQSILKKPANSPSHKPW